jgi:hypothetical protein
MVVPVMPLAVMATEKLAMVPARHQVPMSVMCHEEALALAAFILTQTGLPRLCSPSEQLNRAKSSPLPSSNTVPSGSTT